MPRFRPVIFDDVMSYNSLTTVCYSDTLSNSSAMRIRSVIFILFQVFVCIIDREEAIKRIVERDGKTEEEAVARLVVVVVVVARLVVVVVVYSIILSICSELRAIIVFLAD